MVILLFSLAFLALFALITFCVAWLCKLCNSHQPTCSARYTIDVNTDENSEGATGNDFGTHKEKEVSVNESTLDSKDGVIVIQLHSMKPV